jgi:hypothetical protein
LLLSKSIRTGVKSSYNASVTVSLRHSQYGMTCVHSQAETMPAGVSSEAYDPSETNWLFPAGSPARTYLRQDGARVSEPEAVRDCGVNIRESLARFGLRLSLPKIPRCWSVEGLTSLSLTLPRWGMTCDGACWELGTSAHLTCETEFGYWPTPKATASGPDFARANRAGSGGDDLATALVRREMLPTPRKRDWKDTGTVPPSRAKDPGKDTLGQRLARFATPKKLDATHGGPNQRDSSGNPALPAQVGGPPNPPWIEWLMGWPIGWTESKPLATVKFRSWLLSFGEYLAKG